MFQMLLYRGLTRIGAIIDTSVGLFPIVRCMHFSTRYIQPIARTIVRCEENSFRRQRYILGFVPYVDMIVPVYPDRVFTDNVAEAVQLTSQLQFTKYINDIHKHTT